MKRLRKYWGYLAFLVLLVGWLIPEVGPVFLIVLSVLVTAYFLFLAPMWCGAETREGLSCRNNSPGLLMGCHLREHRWQKLKMAFIPRRWRELNRGLWTNPKEGLTTLSTIVAIISGIAATIVAIVGQ